MSDKIEIIQNPQNDPVLPYSEDSSIKRIIAEAMKHGGLKEFYVETDGKKRTYIEYLSIMAWDGITEGAVTFADGTRMNIQGEPKIWLELVKFIAGHLDGQVNANAQFNGVNIFKIYKGIDPDQV
jgi:hypothetical protein